MQGAQPDGARTTLTGDVPTLDAVAVNARVAVIEPFDPARPGAPRDAYPAVVASVDGATGRIVPGQQGQLCTSTS
jgi:hypothetical protein